MTQGTLRGPFSGRVTDSGTDRPIAGAIVYATWTVQSGHGLTAPGGYREHVTSTDADGRYKVPKVSKVPSGSSRVTDFYIVVYKRGYVAYRSDRRFADLGPRMDFAQDHNKIELDRWTTDLSHVKHVRFIGGGSAIAALTAWESEEAARELSGEAGRSLSTDPFGGGGDGAAAAVVAARLLRPEDVVEVTGFDGSFEAGPLGDDPDTTQYSSVHLRAMDRPESFDVALRLWKVDPGQAQSRYGQLLDTLPTAEEVNEIGDRSLRATEADIRGVAFLDGKRGAVVLITCGAAQCRTPDEVVGLGRRVFERLETIWPMGANR